MSHLVFNVRWLVAQKYSELSLNAYLTAAETALGINGPNIRQLGNIQGYQAVVL